MPAIEGRCHCGNLAFVFVTSAELETLGLRACQCTFCRAHGARTTSDPNGRVRLAVEGPAQQLTRYRFGLKTADFLICRECGVFIGAEMVLDGSRWMTLNANTFRPPPPADFPVARMDFETEDAAARIARRLAKWTPVAI